jgi:hypothetical protein
VKPHEIWGLGPERFEIVNRLDGSSKDYCPARDIDNLYEGVLVAIGFPSSTEFLISKKLECEKRDKFPKC